MGKNKYEKGYYFIQHFMHCYGLIFQKQEQQYPFFSFFCDIIICLHSVR